MPVTVEEARKMRCQKMQNGRWCVATQCMAWRFAVATRSGVDEDEVEELKKDGWVITGYKIAFQWATYSMQKRYDKGYCGLAGE